jgi:peptide/nickel transport system substrate-binding protein
MNPITTLRPVGPRPMIWHDAMTPSAAMANSWSRRALLAHALGCGFAATGAGSLSCYASSSVSADGDRLTVIYNHNQWDLDPHTSFSDAAFLFFGIYEMLLQLNGSSVDDYAPMLADAWEANGDGSSYTFHLSPSARFHDGSPCDAATVKASFNRLLALGAAPSGIFRRFVQDPQQMAVLDEQTIRFDLGRPQPLFLDALTAFTGMYVVNPRLVEAHRSDEDPWAHEWLSRNTAGAGTGPYVVSEDRPNEWTRLTRFDDYHRGWNGEHFAEIVIQVVAEDAARRELLERGDAEVITRLLTPHDVAALEEIPALGVEVYDAFDVGWIVMNAPKLRSAAVRRGFSCAFPYDEVVNNVEGGLRKRTGPLPEGLRGYDPNVFLYQTDLARAKELIQSGGFQEGDVFDYVHLAGSESSALIAQLFQANLQAIGFALELIEVEQAALFDIGFGELPAEERPDFLGSWGWYPDYNDPWMQLAPSFLRSYTEGGEGTANAGLWYNARFEAIMAEAKTYTDEARLDDLMKEAQRILTLDDPPCIYIGQQRYVTILGDDIRGFVANPLALNWYRFYDLYCAPAQPQP